MKLHELNSQLQKLNDLIVATKSLPIDDVELQGHWGKYLCVLVAGFLENALANIYIEFSSRASAPQVASFTSNMLKRVNNPKASKFVEIAYCFKKEWGQELENYLKQNPEIKDAVDSIMANRHLIAHGKSTSISIGRVKEYLMRSIKLLDFIEKQCNI